MKVNFAPRTVEEEIEQNISCIIDTVAGTVPLFREFGLDTVNVDMRIEFLESQMSNKILSAVQEFEPRVIVTEVVFSEIENGMTNPKVIYDILPEVLPE
ncbi:GPW/gp25 family protein [Paenibacillus alvei]|uniref:GPW/gp25 family protein n=1 Tax=Paenibacillus alvei TaxID=44250 RepID=UPI0013DB3D2F|nr:GPW/gp25 family protein [Paenibacillus alvei]NEZ43723.1 baseplate assembly protein [Paenibacillus alvei]